MKRKSRKELRLTMNSRVYKMAKREMEGGCSLCAPNKGCNQDWNIDNNWKQHRKSQWRE